ncbi:hypothetical protein FPZ42_06935 [Mucilaginibacter achroorhodeus]|uniref:Uncharacterized protein n=1 Tax=Mucilaginibacter achroorhodeus TaxID=2599294 RepID=A0A563U606_9SPHI|nr:hypothetical protein [Mucilaginibacter achroorhodeus]TWR26765.1 hypothetical protein FPZ42_06935 [Mucilaginibacter achroorhodeus]
MADNLFYNPFLRIREDTVTKLMAAGRSFVVIQRFPWPGMHLQQTFLLSAYAVESEAHYHETALGSKEGKMQNLLLTDHYRSVLKLLKTGSGINLFFNGTIDKKHEQRLQKAYQKAVSTYIHGIKMKKEDHFDVRIFVEYGRLKAEITSGEQSHTALFYDMIK